MSETTMTYHVGTPKPFLYIIFNVASASLSDEIRWDNALAQLFLRNSGTWPPIKLKRVEGVGVLISQVIFIG